MYLAPYGTNSVYHGTMALCTMVPWHCVPRYQQCVPWYQQCVPYYQQCVPAACIMVATVCIMVPTAMHQNSHFNLMQLLLNYYISCRSSSSSSSSGSSSCSSSSSQDRLLRQFSPRCWSDNGYSSMFIK